MAAGEPAPEADLDLLRADRELSDEEIRSLRQHTDLTWQTLGRLVRQHAQITFARADPVDFADCVAHHLDPAQKVDLIAAEMFTCPACGRLLKDRRRPVSDPTPPQGS